MGSIFAPYERPNWAGLAERLAASGFVGSDAQTCNQSGAIGDSVDNVSGVGIFANMDAELLLRERVDVGPGVFAELVIWRVPAPVRSSHHGFKYRLALVADGECVLRYDNEAGKGDHKHIGGDEVPYTFTDPASLLKDFWRDVEPWR